MIVGMDVARVGRGAECARIAHDFRDVVDSFGHKNPTFKPEPEMSGYEIPRPWGRSRPIRQGYSAHFGGRINAF